MKFIEYDEYSLYKMKYDNVRQEYDEWDDNAYFFVVLFVITINSWMT